MGILNLTPDSFSDGGAYNSVEGALARAQSLIDEGADIIDMGAESTRPDSSPIEEQEELARLLAPLKAVRKRFENIPISIDTYKPSVAASAIECGADIINDVRAAGCAGGYDASSEMPKLAAKLNCPLIIMHNSFGAQIAGEIKEDVLSSLLKSAQICLDAGLSKSQIVFDIGFGFGKTSAQNLEMLKNIDYFRRGGYPLLLGLSRKRTIGEVTGLPKDDRDLPSAIADAWALFKGGVDILRVHNVAKNKIAIEMVAAIKCPGKWTK